ncbi:Hypothetical predicted protein [Octopus vulgaris]|uniref:Uncharacterized protein n=1 Tax=Octopus vulgaris TaxID=6645 RepID=A0AA36BRM6_OCTVU|nr:Hypothetical predicted protein [Octopus vulgaris]
MGNILQEKSARGESDAGESIKRKMSQERCYSKKFRMRNCHRGKFTGKHVSRKNSTGKCHRKSSTGESVTGENGTEKSQEIMLRGKVSQYAARELHMKYSCDRGYFSSNEALIAADGCIGLVSSVGDAGTPVNGCNQSYRSQFLFLSIDQYLIDRVT